ncbi:MAG TPA: efflux RND transporter permease subunit [Gammaproteobacteria bacterium]|nr:efflux RND transporter permease subunit [Gammaproteobacteria bacterium]
MNVPERLNAVGRVTRLFLRSKITALLMLAAAIFGAMAVAFTPRMYNPEIAVPAANVLVSFQGASAAEVQQQVVKPLEALMGALPGVDHTYGYAADDLGVVTVQFDVGEDEEKSLVKLYNQINRNLDRMPPGVSQPLIKSIGINDAPIVTITLSSASLSQTELRGVALRMMEPLRALPDVGDTQIVGGTPRTVTAYVDPARLASTGLALDRVEAELGAANVALPGSELVSGGRESMVRVSGVLGDAQEVGNVIIGTPNGKPVYLKDVARIEDGPEEPEQYSYLGHGPGTGKAGVAGPLDPAVTLAIDKRAGANAVDVADAVLGKLEELKLRALPQGVDVTVTRDDGAKADEAVNTLIEHLGIAVASVAAILLLFLGWREAAIVTLTVPLVLGVVLGVGWVIGQTINRITLFALILSLGLLVDDAIVVIENIHRRLHQHGRTRFRDRLVFATNEIGKPTNIATLAVILAFIPMAFVGGMMGPFMRPIPINAPVAMLVSLATAYIVVPWVSWRWLRGKAAGILRALRAPTLEEQGHAPKDRLRALYLKGMAPLMASSRRRRLFVAGVVALLLLALLQPMWQFLRPRGIDGPRSFAGVTLKMLPDDNTSTFLVEVDTAAGTPLTATDEVARQVGTVLADTRYVRDFQAFVGQPAPPDFAALVRGDPIRGGHNFAQLRVNLVPKSERPGSHVIAQALAPRLAEVAAQYPGARIKLYETPPGPPVRSQVLAELYGPDYGVLRGAAAQVREAFAGTYGMINVDDSVTQDAEEYRIVVDPARAALAGVQASAVARTLHDYLAGFKLGMLHVEDAREPIAVRVRIPQGERGFIRQVMDLRITAANGRTVPLGSVVSVEQRVLQKPYYSKDQHPVVYVTGETLAGSPVNAVLALQGRLDGAALSDGSRLRAGNLGFVAGTPDDVSRYQLSWDGEMRLTLDVFRDLGSAFMVALIFIYLLLAAYYQSFFMPLIVMGAIPLTLVGVFPGHWLLGQPFTATSMIGVIALAGIVVRNSLLLMDFMLDYLRQGQPLAQAVMEAGAVRFRPILLTALAIISASLVMVGDPVFGGLAISLIFGTFASTVLTLFVIPLVYYKWARYQARRAGSVPQAAPEAGAAG